MKLIVHGPTNPENSAELARRVAELHAEAILTYIKNQPLTKEKKICLFRSIYQNKRDLD